MGGGYMAPGKENQLIYGCGHKVARNAAHIFLILIVAGVGMNKLEILDHKVSFILGQFEHRGRRRAEATGVEHIYVEIYVAQKFGGHNEYV